MFAQIATSAKASNEPTNNARLSAKATARRSTSLPPSVPRESSLAAKTPARPQKKFSRPPYLFAPCGAYTRGRTNAAEEEIEKQPN
jgi:hypothetical protein